MAKNKKNMETEEIPADIEKEASPEEAPQEKEKCEEAENKHAEELAAEKERYLRLAAEYDNFRKRSAREREALFADIKSETILKLLPVYDNLERALRCECSDAAFYKGVVMTMDQLTKILDSMGVKVIEAVGQKFDPAKHNAVMHIEDENLGENEIAEEFQKGFTLGEKVIRFSVVKVAN